MNHGDCDLNLKWQSKVIKISCISLISLFIIWVCYFKTSRQTDLLDDYLTSEEKDNKIYMIEKLSFMSSRLRDSFWAKESDK